MSGVEFRHSMGRVTNVVQLVTDQELANPIFLADLKTFLVKLRIPRRRLIDWLIDGYGDAETTLLDEEGNRVFLDLEALEEQEGRDWTVLKTSIEDWLKDWVRMPERHAVPRLRREAKERVRLIATLLRVIFPKETLLWGQPEPLTLTDQDGAPA